MRDQALEHCTLAPCASVHVWHSGHPLDKFVRQTESVSSIFCNPLMKRKKKFMEICITF
jgi:hypothetical protein